MDRNVSDEDIDDKDNDFEDNGRKEIILDQTINTDLIDCDSIEPVEQFSITDPIVNFFLTFFDEDIIVGILVQTNLYANQNKLKYWTDTSKFEIKAFLGLILMMGLNNLPSIGHVILYFM